ncbi:54S ribosomal protein L7 [Trichophyton equinum CBS 127.97]|uniref:Large ribosomal subunit protein uL5m n=1 Tax=Trichophyton equinum (strain ATCC MYA-4606 / CBS 127.97) TaxID=559882 RepID=F2PPZ1_TRIEC|nr:54S ribosomal protein L7 [Trichophyton equinum CBS 127.97]
MALHESMSQLPRALSRRFQPVFSSQLPAYRRNASSESSSSSPLDDLEPSSSFSTPQLPEEKIKEFDPVARSKARKHQLPRSRYQYRSPKYDRGPLNPHRPPPTSHPSSRLFVPGPFSLTRVEQTYNSTVASDILTLCYVHKPHGFKPPPPAPRLRQWDDSSPYHKNRPLRGPRGGDVLRLLRKPITFNNIPELSGVTVHSYVKDAVASSSFLHVAGMTLQAITNVRVKTHKVKTGVPKWGLIPGHKHVAATAELEGEDMYHFFSKLVDVVMPKFKDWKGVKVTSGDGSGNITLGLEPSMVAMFPEIEVNYDMYPPRMIPGCHITIKTTARTDKDARILLNAMGVPFDGKLLK